MNLLRVPPPLFLAALLFAACGDTNTPSPDDRGEGELPACASLCGPNQHCTSEGKCACESGFLDCDGNPENGCEIEAEACESCSCPEEGTECNEEGQCVRFLGAYEVCKQGGRSLGECAPEFECLRAGSESWSVCHRTCTTSEDCPSGERCGFGLSGMGLCLEPREPGESCHASWWEGPGHCLDPGNDSRLCLDGVCKILCDYTDKQGQRMTCPWGQICDGEPTEYPEHPGLAFKTCIDRPSMDPCRELPAGGRCSAYQSYERCGEDGLVVEELHCEPSERCEDGPEGASCVPLPSRCAPGHAYCESETSLMRCEPDRSWSRSTCETGCRSSPLGASCLIDAPTRTIHGTLLYERTDPNPSLTDWMSRPSKAPAAGLMALSLRDEEVIDSSSVADDGSFALQLFDEPDPARDQIVFLASGGTLDMEEHTFFVADPGLEPGTWTPGFSDAEPWLWSIGVPESSGETYVIEEAMGSPAIQIFSAIRKGMRRNAAAYGPNPATIVAWYGPGVAWSCGTCYTPPPSPGWNSQIFVDGGPDRNWASDFATLHELGHFTMEIHGFPHQESGNHCILNPTLPGLAWTEGYANWYAAEIRRDGLHYLKMWDTLIYMDLDLRGLGTLRPVLPTPSEGVLQWLDEAWITASLRHIAEDAGSSAPIWEALVSPHMTEAPFPRGYLAQRFWGTDEACNPINPAQTNDPAPTFPDFLDALICGGLPPAIIDGVVAPHYPYSSDEPLCREG